MYCFDDDCYELILPSLGETTYHPGTIERMKSRNNRLLSSSRGGDESILFKGN